MPYISLHISLSGLFLFCAIGFAWKKRSILWPRLSLIVLSVFWLPGVTANSMARHGSSYSWGCTILSMGWLSALMVLGLCLMWSKRIHFLGREIVILSLLGIASLLIQLILSF